MRFRHKLLLAFSGLLGFVLVAALWTVNRLENRRAVTDVLLGLLSTQQVFERILAERQRQLESSLNLLSGDFAFKQAVATGEAATVHSAAVNHKSRIGSDLLLVTDGEGKVLADTRRLAKPGSSLAKEEVVREALEGKPNARVQVLGGVPVQLAATPINAPDLIGVLVAGFKVDDDLAAQLKKLTASDMAFVSGDKVFASTLPGPARDALAAKLGEIPADRPAILALDGERYLVLGTRRSTGVAAYLMRSWDRALEPSRELQQALLVVGLAGFAVVFIVGLLIAAQVTAPLGELVEATKKIARGEYDISLRVRSKDEVGQLGEAFGQMALGLNEREKIRSVLRKAVSKEIAEALLAKGQIELGGEEKPVTVLFADIRSFTTISESLRPKELVSQLNDYFIKMARAISAHHGVIDKYVGDAIMALFGAPLGTPEDAAHAVRAALAMVKALAELNAERKAKGLEPWSNGVGLNTGTVVAGTLGSEDRWSYTVIGDSVNLASRLEALTKRYGARVLVSEATRDAAGPGFVWRPLGRVVVKGKSEPVGLFEALGEGEPPPWLATYEKAWEAFRAGKSRDAQALFLKVLEAAPEDPPSMALLQKAKDLEGQPPAVFDEPVHMTEK